MRKGDKSKIRVYRIDCIIRGARRCVRSAVRYHPPIVFLPHARSCFPRSQFGSSRSDDLLSRCSPSSLSDSRSMRCLRLMVPLDVSSWQNCRWRNWSSSYSLIRIETKRHSFLVDGFTSRVRRWPGAARTRIHSRCACWAWWLPCCAASRCRFRCYRRSLRMSSSGCCRAI